MAGFCVRWICDTLALMAVVWLVPGISVDSVQTLVAAALVLGLVNATLRPVLLVWTLPFNILSLGLLTLFINGLLFYAVSKLVAGFWVAGFASAFWGALAMAIVSFLLNTLISSRGRVSMGVYRQGSARRRYDDVIDTKGTHDPRADRQPPE